jgi:hypothetical protein
VFIEIDTFGVAALRDVQDFSHFDLKLAEGAADWDSTTFCATPGLAG